MWLPCRQPHGLLLAVTGPLPLLTPVCLNGRGVSTALPPRSAQRRADLAKSSCGPRRPRDPDRLWCRRVRCSPSACYGLFAAGLFARRLPPSLPGRRQIAHAEFGHAWLWKRRCRTDARRRLPRRGDGGMLTAGKRTPRLFMTSHTKQVPHRLRCRAGPLLYVLLYRVATGLRECLDAATAPTVAAADCSGRT